VGIKHFYGLTQSQMRISVWDTQLC